MSTENKEQNIKEKKTPLRTAAKRGALKTEAAAKKENNQKTPKSSGTGRTKTAAAKTPKTKTVKAEAKTASASAKAVKTKSAGKGSKVKKDAVKTEVLPLKVIPIGGLNEIGKNMTLLEYDDQILIIDCGMSFPDDDMFGIDSVIPDFTYLVENSSKVKGLILTHGHEDHIGGIPYLLKQINVPIYGTRLTLGLIENKLKEHGLSAKLHTIKAGDRIRIGAFDIETIRTTHSIADAICLSIDTPAGRVFHTGDFKVDYTPVDGEKIDFRRLAEIGLEGVDLLLADSTNAIRQGYTASERVVGQNLETIFRRTNSRIIIATFSSNVHRVQKIIDNAVLCKRKVAISGRSMVNVVNLAIELGYISIPENVLVDINKLKGIPDKELVIITTGSQGEPMSALSRMATNDHKSVRIRKGDTVILSSTPVPGNEKMVANVVNKLYEKGAKVIYSDIADIHVSGHACQEELKLIHSLIKPKYFMPVHGEYRHLKHHALLAQELGLPSNHIFILENGDALTYNKKRFSITKGFAPAEAVFVDGLGVGDVGSIVLRVRKMLSEAGLIVVVAALDSTTNRVVSGPDIITRGFVYVKENEDLIEKARVIAEKALDRCINSEKNDRSFMKNAVRDSLRGFINHATGRSPVILSIFLDV